MFLFTPCYAVQAGRQFVNLVLSIDEQLLSIVLDFQITAYFMGLVPQSSGYVMKLKDRATNYEKLFTQSEIEGSPSLKMDLALSNPIIIMPRATYSNE
jgi:hypothetical protein